MAKLLRAEIFALAKRIIEQVNENNKAHNAELVESEDYKKQIKQIQSRSIVIGIEKTIQRSLRSKLGNDFDSMVKVVITPLSGSSVYSVEEQIKKELADYTNSVKKPIYSLKTYSEKPSVTLQKVIDDITIAQMELTDIDSIVAQVKGTLS